MGQKIHPVGYRLSVNKNWNSRWYFSGKSYSNALLQDIKARDFLEKKLKHAGLGKVVIDRSGNNARVILHSSRPGVIIGKKGEDVEILKVQLSKILDSKVHVVIEEVKRPELDSKIIAESIAQQLEKRVAFRRAMKRAQQLAVKAGAVGIKVMCSGRLNGADIARSEWYREGRVPLHTLKSNIDYSTARALTTYGIIGIKVWVYREDFKKGSDSFKSNVLSLKDGDKFKKRKESSSFKKDAENSSKRVRKVLKTKEDVSSSIGK